MHGGLADGLEAEKKSRLAATKGRLDWFRLVDVQGRGGMEGLPRQYTEAKLWDWLRLTHGYTHRLVHEARILVPGTTVDTLAIHM